MKVFDKHKNGIMFLPIGGSGKMGLNMNLYSHNGTYIAIDCGSGFPDYSMPGIEILVPDIDQLISNKIKLNGIIFTHAHEDHIGAICYLWHMIKCPLYASKFVIEMIKSKLSEYNFKQEVKFIEIKPLSSFKIGSFTFEMINMTHSIPEMHAILIKADNTTIFHTGDWKLDPNPVIGLITPEKKLKEIGNNGVSAVIGDSTNIFNPGWSKSESSVENSIYKAVKSAKQMVIISTFASNIARIKTICNVARKTNRHIFLSGTSLHRITAAAQRSGYILDEKFHDIKELDNYRRHHAMIICTGCQGEELATLAKLANQTHHFCKVRSGDLIILSSKIIPGNENKILSLLNKFADLDIDVITEKQANVHVSGHPYRDEVQYLYKLLKPQYVIPTHGEIIHLMEHAEFAKNHCKIKAHVVKNGDAILITNESIKSIGKIRTGYLGLDGLILRKPDSKVMIERRQLMQDGAIICTLFMQKHHNIKRSCMTFIGCIGNEYPDIIQQIENSVESTLKKISNHNQDDIKREIFTLIKRIVHKEAGVYPLIDINCVDA